MRIRKTVQFLAVAVLGWAFMGAAWAHQGYAVDTQGRIIKNSYGECWHSMGKLGASDDQAPVECGGVADSDGDGVPDSKDKCPGTPKGMAVDMDGCHDTDGDGVPNADDKCPGTPRGAKVDSVGCEVLDPIVLKGVHFAHDKATLTSEAKGILDDNLGKINRNASRIKALHIVGHTDSTGSDSYNQSLSERRAKAVADYLNAQGLDVGTMTKGMGEGSPVADNASREGRAMNRRVEITFE